VAEVMFLPLFPLELVAFPGEQLKLHVFEPRYKQLFAECESEGQTFGLPAFVDGRLAEYGTEMRLVQVFNRYPGGELDVLTEGVRVFHLERFVRETPGKLYAGAHVTFIENDSMSYPVTQEEVARQYRRFHELLQSPATREDFSKPNVSFEIAHEIGMTLIQKVKLLSIPREADRQLAIVEHLHNVIPMVEAAENTRKRVRGNGHFHKPPPLEF
jgi:Lon protease-like protein